MNKTYPITYWELRKRIAALEADAWRRSLETARIVP